MSILDRQRDILYTSIEYMKCNSKGYTDRVHRITGQVAALEHMFEERRSAQDIVQQIVAARASLSSLAKFIVDAEVRGCLPRDAASEPLEKLVESLFKVS